MDDGRRIVSVGQVNEYVKRVLEQNTALRGLFIRGEISNLKFQSSGHIYFTLKDETAGMMAVMFKFNVMNLKFRPENGMKVLCLGKITLYPPTGSYQINVEQMEPDGIGALYIAYEQLKKKLEAEGVFSGVKMDLPLYPRRIGIITSPTGAALHDMLNVTRRRWPYAEIIFYPAMVQGPEAPPTLCRAVDFFSEKKNVDVVILGRGGGSMEDLWAFNDETLVRKVAACEVPIVSAVGHETDFTLCDFAADRRAPTPSAAAELVVPDYHKVKDYLENADYRMNSCIGNRMNFYRNRVEQLSKSRVLTDPLAPVKSLRESLGQLEMRLSNRMDRTLESRKAMLGKSGAKLEALSPLRVVSRGYSAVFDRERKVIKSITQLQVGEEVSFMVTDGTVGAKVTRIEEQKHE